jgi:hypothetical protein
MLKRGEALAGLALALLVPFKAEADGILTVHRGDYRGWADSYTLANGVVEIVVTSAIGPRIVDFRRIGADNVFHLRDSEAGTSGESEWIFRGGWRLWVAPEETDTTYEPDNERCAVTMLGSGGVRVTGPPQSRAGIQKSVDVSLAADRPRARIVSRIRNVSDRPVAYAAWSLSVMKPGGRAFVPFDVGDLRAFSDTRRLILWSYAKFADPRYRFGDRLIQVDHTKVIAPTSSGGSGRRADESKIGVDTRQGWAAYLLGATLYVKRFPHDRSGRYPDKGSTVEIYSSSEFLEVENLSPMVTIQPGHELIYPEEWSLFDRVQIGSEESAALADLGRWLAEAPPVRSIDSSQQ